jgi:hypothetical protein
MKLVRDEEGSAAFGWVGPYVYFARFAGKLSAELSATHVAHLQAAVESTPTIRYFSDSSELTRHDLLARSAFIRLLLRHRKKFSELVFLNWAGNTVLSSELLTTAVGEPLVVLDDRGEFERRLILAAPQAADMVRPKR